MKKLFKKTVMSVALSSAVIGGALMGVSTSVQAVNIAQDGLGEVLVFPYYTTRADWATLFNITNTSNQTVLMKVIWREGLNSRDARDFTVILSPYDTWTAVTRKVPDGSGVELVNGEEIGIGGAEVITADNSCTYPKLKQRDNGLTGVRFTTAAYSDYKNVDNRDNAATTLDRGLEGYFEVYNMGSIDNETAKFEDAFTIAKYSKHEEEINNNKAKPRDCTLVRSVLRNHDKAYINNLLDEPRNVLKGRAVLINADSGIAAGYDPLVLADFTSTSKYADPSQDFPNLAEADPEALVINDGQFNPSNSTSTPSEVLTIDTSGGSTGADAVSALISRTNVINDYNVKGDSATTWVLNFPTKRFYVDQAIYPSNNQSPIRLGQQAPLAPFATAVRGNAFDETSCFNYRLSIWDREEYNVIADQFSPPMPPSGPRMCYEVNLLSFADKNLFSSTIIHQSVTGGDNKGVLPAENGWAEIGFGAGGLVTDSSGGGVARVAALPVIGMRMEVRKRGDAALSYGLANAHAYISNRNNHSLSTKVKVNKMEAKD
ncbi:MAG: hypothetical protein KAG34_01205 [Cocleimonas sp.]|nr:hypothetical protein [Cocleimonas sp.]